jgi:hypothetical protein
MKSVIEFIEQECVFHSKIEYCDSKENFNMPNVEHKYATTLVGIYFIVMKYKNKLYVMKVGKADGARGFYRRFSQYTSFYTHDTVIPEMMPTILENYKGGELRMYYHPMKQTSSKYKGYTLPPSSNARALEIVMTRLAKKEGHPLLLSKIE